MTAPDGFDRLFTAWLGEQAPMREPDGLLPTVSARIERTRRLPGWAILERWLPMQTTARFGAIPGRAARTSAGAVLTFTRPRTGFFDSARVVRRSMISGSSDAPACDSIQEPGFRPGWPFGCPLS